jgi:ribosome biogenesis SPOUT family RNA methylase Rps3
MKSKIAIVGGVLGALIMAGSAAADAKSYQAAVERCLGQYANSNDAATVTLECEAAAGKLGDCKVLENSGSKGFAQAAVCVAKEIPIGDKTGTLKVPVRFAGANG